MEFFNDLSNAKGEILTAVTLSYWGKLFKDWPFMVWAIINELVNELELAQPSFSTFTT